MNQWNITEAEAGERLDSYLKTKLPDQSRSAIQKLIKNGHICVNQRTTSVHHFLKTGDQVSYQETVTTGPSPTQGIQKLATPSTRPAPPDPKVVAESSNWIVINKPAGVLVHPDTRQETSLIDWLLKHDPTIAKVGEHPDRPGIVHRLDREVSGLMVIAKTQDAYEDLQRQFAERRVEKVYLALVHGELSKDEGDIKFRIARSSSQARMAARPAHEEVGRAAWTHYVVKERFVGASLVEIRILSGRTHQIRAHFHALGHPVIGDELYKRQKTDRNIPAPRLMLQSIGLAFTDPVTHTRQTFTLEPDPTFHALTEEFRQS